MRLAAAAVIAVTLLLGTWLTLVRLEAEETVLPPASSHKPHAARRITRPHARRIDRSPVDLAIAPTRGTGHGSWLVSANRTSDTVSLVDVKEGRVIDEIAVGRRPTSITVTSGAQVLVTGSYSGDLTLLAVRERRLHRIARIQIGYQPLGVVASPDGKQAYVALADADQVAVVDLVGRRVAKRIDVGRWPRHLALSPDGRRLAVACSGGGGVWVIDTQARKVAFSEKFGGLNLGQMQVSANGRDVYFPTMFYGNSPTTPGNIRRGWVLGNRLARIGLDRPERRNALTIDTRRSGAADPHGLALTGDGRWVVMSASGAQELVVLLRHELPFVGIGGTEHIDGLLEADRDRIFRIALGGRPMGLRVASDHKTVFVANYLRDTVQVVDLKQRRIVREITLGPTPDSSPARRGEAIFYDARRSLDRWYSCHSCHHEGGANSETIDTLNDGTTFTYKSVPPLYDLHQTGPWTWHGWQKDLNAAMRKSLTSTMRGGDPSQRDVADLLAFLKTLTPPPNPHRTPAGGLTEAALRGKKVFHSAAAGCAECHTGKYFTDGLIHEVGLERSDDRYKGFNTPGLLGLHRRVRLLHDGQVRTLEKLLRGPHAPEKVAGEAKLSDAQLGDLIAYLKSL